MNELTVIEGMEKRLQAKREPIIFPLAANHRKELRQLKEKNIGDLRDTLSNIRTLKKEEYIKKYYDKIQSELKDQSKICKLLNDDWDKRISLINKTLADRKVFEKKQDLTFLDRSTGYDDVAQLSKLTDTQREYKFNQDKIVERIAEKQFNKKYNFSFESVSKKIDDLHTMYEEAINFGDLEIVKKLYYIMKKADNFFTKLEKLDI